MVNLMIIINKCLEFAGNLLCFEIEIWKVIFNKILWRGLEASVSTLWLPCDSEETDK